MRTAYLTLYPGERSELVWYGVEIVYAIAPAPLQGWHDDDVKAREMQAAIFCTPTRHATWHYCYNGDGCEFLRSLRDRVFGNKGAEGAVFEAALLRNGDLAAVTAANSSEELKKVVTRPMFPAGVKMGAGCLTALGDGAVVHAGPALVDACAEPVRVFVAAQCAPAAKFDAAFCEDQPAQIDGFAKLIELGLDSTVFTTRHVQEMRHDPFNRSRGVAAWASVAKRAESDVAKVLNPFCKPPPAAQPLAKDQAVRRTAAESGPATTPSGFTVCEGWPAPAFKHAHTFTFNQGAYLWWGHQGHDYDIEVICVEECPQKGVVLRPIAPDKWEEICVKKGQVIKVSPGARARWLPLGKGPCTKMYSYYKDGHEVEAAGATEGQYRIQCDICRADCWGESHVLAEEDRAARQMRGADVCVKCFAALTNSNSLIASEKAQRLAFGRAWREPLDPHVAEAFRPPFKPAEAVRASGRSGSSYVTLECVKGKRAGEERDKPPKRGRK
jgi:hypothetical protein